jgi:hypothetical protein
MVTSIEAEVQIEDHSEVRIQDPRNHPEETIRALRGLLSSGAIVIPDPKRKSFYEVKSGSLVYYIHISPVSGNILLLATWPAGDQRAPEQRLA